MGGLPKGGGVRKPLQKLFQEWLQLHTKGAVITEDVRTKRLDWSG